MTTALTSPAPTAPVADLLTTAEVALIFRCTRRTIRNRVRAGHLHPIRVGRAVYFSKVAIEELVRGDAGIASSDCRDFPQSHQY